MKKLQHKIELLLPYVVLLVMGVTIAHEFKLL
jgi:hypothetical protein